MENLGTIAVLVATAALYGTGRGLGNLPTGELLLLGLGSTGAVALHAATQWWGARRAGVVLLPRPGWRDSEAGQSCGGRSRLWGKRDWTPASCWPC